MNYILLLMLSNSWVTIDRVSAVEVSSGYKEADSSMYSISMLDTNDTPELQFGEVAILERKIKNTGVKPIEIGHIYNMSCGCSGGAAIDKKVLNPGQVGTLRFPYNTFKKKVGINVDTFAVSTVPKEIVPIHGKVTVIVRKDIVFEPQRIDFGRVIGGSGPVSTNVSIISNKDIDVNDISIRPSSSDIVSELAFNKEMIQATDANNPSRKKHMLYVRIDPNSQERRIDEFLKIEIAGMRGRVALFGLKISAEITPIITSEPKRLFLGYVKPTDTIEKTIHVVNEEKGAVEIVDVEFSDDLDACYDIVDLAAWKQGIVVRMKFPIIKESVGRFAIMITVRYNDDQVHKIACPGIYIGATNVKVAPGS